MLISGGKPPTMAVPKGVQFEQLPPMYSADSSFTRLLDAAGNEIDDAWREDRKQRLLELFSGFSPHVLITETFPFGRRMLRFELLPLLQAANDSETCLLVIASIRDILQPKSKAGRNREICDLVEAHYDHGGGGVPGRPRREDHRAAVPVHLAPRHAAAPALRPADAVRMEGAVAPGDAEPRDLGHRHRTGVPELVGTA